MGAEGIDGEWGGAERIFVGGKFDDAGDGEPALYLFGVEACEIRREGLYVRRD